MPRLRAALACRLTWFHAAAGSVASVLTAIVVRNRARLAGTDLSRKTKTLIVCERSLLSSVSVSRAITNYYYYCDCDDYYYNQYYH